MTTITVMRDDEGRIVGATEKDRKAYNAFKKQLHELEGGELFTISAWFPRNPKLHGKHFALLNAIFQAQEQFEDFEVFRKWCTVGAGAADFYPGPTGKMVAIPKSLSFDEMDDIQFADLHEETKRFLRSLHATRFLWPAISDAEAAEMIAGLVDPFEGGS